MQLWPLIKNDPYGVFVSLTKVSLTIVLVLFISTIVYYGTVLNFGKRYEDDLRVIFDQVWIIEAIKKY